jgi:hypothetical protein
MNKYKIFVYIKEQNELINLLYSEKNKNKYDNTLSILIKAEQENKCDLIYYGLCDIKEEFIEVE